MNSNRSNFEPSFASRKSRATALIVATTVLGALLSFAGSIYLDQHAGAFDRLVYSPHSSIEDVRRAQTGWPHPPPYPDPTLGKSVFNRACSPCHQPTGVGVSGVFPPLAGSDWVLNPEPSAIIRIVLDGATGSMTVNGMEFNNTMVPWRDVLSDDEIAAVLTYVRNQWGNDASEVLPEQVKQIRDATADRAGSPWTADDLQKIPEG